MRKFVYIRKDKGYTVLTTDYVGNIIYENGTLKQIMLPDGYWQNGVFYYYLKDHLGSNRATINSSGTVVEKSHYYPSGTRFYTESTSNSNALAYRYNGKEMETMNGLNQMDYGARRRFSWNPSWTAIDPLAEKYYSVSPYAYCAGNPVKFVDINGCEIDLSGMSDEEKKRYEMQISNQKQNSEVFNTMYTALESSKNVFSVKFGKTDENNVDGIFKPNKEGGGIVTFLPKEDGISGSALSEEFFHAYQQDNKEGYGNGDFNREFEAKVFTTVVGLESGGFGTIDGMDDFQSKIQDGDYGNNQQAISPEAVVSESFVSTYTNYANSYAKYNIKNNIGNGHYKTNTTTLPYSLQKVIIDTYNKK